MEAVLGVPLALGWGTGWPLSPGDGGRWHHGFVEHRHFLGWFTPSFWDGFSPLSEMVYPHFLGWFPLSGMISPHFLGYFLPTFWDDFSPLSGMVFHFLE